MASFTNVSGGMVVILPQRTEVANGASVDLSKDVQETSGVSAMIKGEMLVPAKDTKSPAGGKS